MSMECRHCGKGIAEYRTDAEAGMKWRHTHTLRIYCTTFNAGNTKAEPDVPIEQTEAWDLPAQEEADHNREKEMGE